MNHLAVVSVCPGAPDSARARRRNADSLKIFNFCHFSPFPQLELVPTSPSNYE